MNPKKLGELEIKDKVVEVFWISTENLEKKAKEVPKFFEIARVKSTFDISTPERDIVEKMVREIAEKKDIGGKRILVIIKKELASAPIGEERGWLHNIIEGIVGEWRE